MCAVKYIPSSSHKLLRLHGQFSFDKDLNVLIKWLHSSGLLVKHQVSANP